MHTGTMSREDKGRDQGDAATSQGTSEVVSKPPEARGEPWNIFSLSALRRNHSMDTLISNF